MTADAVHHAASPSALEELARSIAARCLRGDIVALIGPVGAGKSVFARAAAAALGVRGPMPSPTFQIVASYDAEIPILHVDLYRLTDAAEFDYLGIEEDMQRAISFVEWAERVPALLAMARIAVTIEPEPGGDEGPDVRRVTVRVGAAG